MDIFPGVIADGVQDTRLLELRSGLFFEYPKLKMEDKNLLFFLPFWENPIISENKEARLVEYDIINRGSTIFTHTGASSRSIDIEFTLTLPHIMRSMNSVLSSKRLLESLNTDKEKKRFENVNPFSNEVKTTDADKVLKQWQELVYGSRPTPVSLQTALTPGGIGVLERNVLPQWDGTYTTRFGGTRTVWPQALMDTQGNLGATPAPPSFPSVEQVSPLALRSINTVVYLLNIIRTCVAGNAVNTVLGPPILRLRHGASYNDVPLIAQNYNISVEQEAGYDLKTLLPYRTKISLTTSELRAGDFGRFKPGTAVKRDNLAGWEAVFEHGTTDPGSLRS